MYVLPRSQRERLGEVGKKRAHPPTPKGSSSAPYFWDAPPAGSPRIFTAISDLPISFLTRDAIVKMSYITLGYLDSLCTVFTTLSLSNLFNTFKKF